MAELRDGEVVYSKKLRDVSEELDDGLDDVIKDREPTREDASLALLVALAKQGEAVLEVLELLARQGAPVLAVLDEDGEDGRLAEADASYAEHERRAFIREVVDAQENDSSPTRTAQRIAAAVRRLVGDPA